MIAVDGIIIDLLLFNIILSLNRMHKRAKQLADERMEKLSEHEQQFKALTDNANDGIISIDEQGNITYVNDSAQRMFGYASEMVIGRPVSMLFPVAQQSALAEALNNSSKDDLHNNKKRFELEGIRKNSEVFPMEFSLSSNTRRVGGTGLGLCIVKYIVEQFNGHVGYLSDPGKETTFFFDIPAMNPATGLVAEGPC